MTTRPPTHPAITAARHERRIAILGALTSAACAITCAIMIAGAFSQWQFVKVAREIIAIQDDQIAELRARVADLERGQ